MKRIGKEYTIEEKLKYLKYKAEHEDTPLSKKLDILELLAQQTGLFGNEFNPEVFLRKLHKLTADINPKPKEK